MAVEISGNTASLNKTLKESSNNLNAFNKRASNVAKSIVAVFAFDRMASFASSVVKVTSEFQNLKLF